MTIISQCRVDRFRNLQSVDLSFSRRYNFIYGLNGSGKTSILEAIYTLANGKSFRSSVKSHIIQHGQEAFTLFVATESPRGDHKIGLEKSHQGNARLQIDGQKHRSLAKAAEILPLILVDPHSYGLIEEGPGYRREYLDWLLFHVEHDYRKIAQEYAHCLQQRNSALRQQLSRRECKTWDEILAELGEKITSARQNMLATLKPYYQQQVDHLQYSVQIDIDYLPGWDTELTLYEALQASIDKDLLLGYTSIGPQRADVEFRVNNHPAADVLSRGQTKLAIAALLFAQGVYYAEREQNTPIYLIDDFASELDRNNRAKLFDLMDRLPGQFFVTATEAELLVDYVSQDTCVFHVEHGVCTLMQ